MNAFLHGRAASAPEEPVTGVDRAFIGGLVRDFYGRVRKNQRLGPIFAREITGDWDPHLEKMTDFWCSVILKTGAYQGRPVPAAHGHVGDHQVEVDLSGDAQGRLGADRLVDLPSTELQQGGDPPARGGRVVDDQCGQHDWIGVGVDEAVKFAPMSVVTEILGFDPAMLDGLVNTSAVGPVVVSVYAAPPAAWTVTR